MTIELPLLQRDDTCQVQARPILARSVLRVNLSSKQTKQTYPYENDGCTVIK